MDGATLISHTVVCIIVSYPLQSVRTYERYHDQQLKINSSPFVFEFVMASVASFVCIKKIDCILLHFFVTDVLTACRNM